MHFELKVIYNRKAIIEIVVIEASSIDKKEVDNSTGAIISESKNTEVKVPDVSAKAAFIIGIEVSLDPNKIWDGMRKLILEE